MTFYLFNNDGHVYCEPLHAEYMPVLAACGFDTEERAFSYAAKMDLSKKKTKVKNYNGAREMLLCMNIEHKESTVSEFMPAGV